MKFGPSVSFEHHIQFLCDYIFFWDWYYFVCNNQFWRIGRRNPVTLLINRCCIWKLQCPMFLPFQSMNLTCVFNVAVIVVHCIFMIKHILDIVYLLADYKHYHELDSVWLWWQKICNDFMSTSFDWFQRVMLKGNQICESLFRRLTFLISQVLVKVLEFSLVYSTLCNSPKSLVWNLPSSCSGRIYRFHWGECWTQHCVQCNSVAMDEQGMTSCVTERLTKRMCP